MVVLRDEKRIAKLARLGQIASLLGLLALVAGLLFIFMSDNPNVFLYQLVALVIGFGLSQVGLYLSHRYLRRPRLDQVLDKAAGKFARKDGRLYHYLLPAPHVLLLPVGVVVLVAKYQGGRISVQGDRWTQGGVGMRRFFGREGLGNPTREAEAQAARMTAMIQEVAPTAADVPVLPVIVFTTPNLDTLDLKESRIPATHAAKLGPVLRQQTQALKPLLKADYDALRAAFDAKAAHLLEETVNADAE
ncbi:MAG: NERD domain-containing protein [Candidatus Promineofilum sp.]|nr:NERD domain-containing protein [Promineifilum sp.]